MASSLDFFQNLQDALSAYRIDGNVLKSLKNYEKYANNLIPNYLEAVKKWIFLTKMLKPLENKGVLEHFLENQKRYWKEFFSGKIEKDYINSRMEMGNYYAHINLSLSAYCALISFRLSWWDNSIKKSDLNKKDKEVTAEALQKLVLLDTGVTCAAYTVATNRQIESQNETLIRLSTPTIQLWEGILLLPIIGILDSVRAQNMMDDLLKRIVSTSSPVAIIDIAGVPNVDSSVANHLIKIAKAAKLLGSTCILSGISPEVAQALVEVGVNLEEINTTSTLRNAFTHGLKLVGKSIGAREADDGNK
jgi:rsbT co-antagonist protein RsbR